MQLLQLVQSVQSVQLLQLRQPLQFLQLLLFPPLLVGLDVSAVLEDWEFPIVTGYEGGGCLGGSSEITCKGVSRSFRRDSSQGCFVVVIELLQQVTAR